MARYTASIETPRPPAETFAYLSDFSTTQEWDPGVVKARRIGDAPVGHGTEFRLVAVFLGRRTGLTYRIVEFSPGKAVTLRGENATVVSLDRITFEPSDGGTRVTYDAELALKGPLRIADPLLGLAFDRVGDRALEGLRETLGSRQARRLPRLSGRSLDGHHHHLPDDLPAQHTFIVAAFRREQQALVDEWLPWLVDLEERREDIAVYELPVSPPRIRRPAGSSTAAWRAASGPTPPAPGRSRSTPTSRRPCANSDCPAPTRSASCSSTARAASSPASTAPSTTRRRCGSPRHSRARAATPDGRRARDHAGTT
jgi:carbon monoxide dehydrogenase subunit G